jgi:hypothetical protein
MQGDSSEILKDFDNIQFGDHICSIYKNKEEKFSVVAPFFMSGLSRNEKCIYVSEEYSKEELSLELEKFGMDVKKLIETGQLLILNTKEIYVNEDNFVPDRTIELWKLHETNAIREGFSGVRITGEATCVCQDKTENEKILEYEAKLNGIFPNMKIVALCQYAEDRLHQNILIESIHTHPMIFIYGKQHTNLYYTSSTFIDSTRRLPIDCYTMIRDSIIEEKY